MLFHYTAPRYTRGKERYNHEEHEEHKGFLVYKLKNLLFIFHAFTIFEIVI